MDSEYNNGYEDDVEYENEYNVYDRVGGVLENDIIAELGINIEEVGGERDPVHRFALFVSTVATEMTNQGYINLNLKQDIPYMLRRIPKIPYPGYKNPTGFVLGYWLVSSNETYDRINKKRFNNLNNNLSKIDYPIKSQDVIRYARLWITHDLLND